MIDSGVRRIAGAVLGAVLLITLTGAVLDRRDPPSATAGASAADASDRGAPPLDASDQGAPPPGASGRDAAAANAADPGVSLSGVSATGTSAADPVTALLRAQAAALLRGDESGWLRAVHPRLHGRYRGLFRTLRALEVSHFDYLVPPRAGGSARFDARVSYCFDLCAARLERPRLAQTLSVEGGLITAVRVTDRPPPWAAGDLVVVRGRRVTVAARPALAGRLASVVRVADAAAAVDDRFAALIGNPQRRYRVFLATPRDWKTWYSARMERWVTAYMQPLGAAGADVVVDAAAVAGDDDLLRLLRHEMGHAATLGGAVPDEDWLVEGLAEYMSRPAPERVAGRRPGTIVASLPEGVGADRARAFYARSHLAVRCLAVMYGERAMMQFARHRLRLDETLDRAAVAAFGRSFATVDRACTAWISNRLDTSRR